MAAEDSELNLLQEGEFQSKYEPKEILGRGLSSVVRKCISRESGQEFAVKIIDKSQDDAIKESIDAEVEILRYLPRHPHIIHLQDFFESQAYIFLVFELARGGELFDFLTNSVRLSLKKTRLIMQQLLSAVEHMHAHGVIHRDLKPENILLDSNGSIKVSDFGFSVKVKDSDELTELLGTPGYLAPEMLRKSVEPTAPGYNKAIDLWACGVIMYTLLAGFPPFWHRKQLVMLRKIMNGQYEFVSPEWDEISDSAKNLIRKLLVVFPMKRLTAIQALDHPFIQTKAEFSLFSENKRFKGLAMGVLFCISIDKSRKKPKLLTLGDIGTSPYENRFIRKLMDGCAFNMYSHWVKRGEEQNRAALFETKPKLKLSSKFSRESSPSKFESPQISFTVS